MHFTKWNQVRVYWLWKRHSTRWKLIAPAFLPLFEWFVKMFYCQKTAKVSKLQLMVIISSCTDIKLFGILYADGTIFMSYEAFPELIKLLCRLNCRAYFLYGCEVYGCKNIYMIEKIYLDFLKSILKLKKRTPNVMVYGEFRRCALEITIKTRMVNTFL